MEELQTFELVATYDDRMEEMRRKTNGEYDCC